MSIQLVLGKKINTSRHRCKWRRMKSYSLSVFLWHNYRGAMEDCWILNTYSCFHSSCCLGGIVCDSATNGTEATYLPLRKSSDIPPAFRALHFPRLFHVQNAHSIPSSLSTCPRYKSQLIHFPHPQVGRHSDTHKTNAASHFAHVSQQIAGNMGKEQTAEQSAMDWWPAKHVTHYIVAYIYINNKSNKSGDVC